MKLKINLDEILIKLYKKLISWGGGIIMTKVELYNDNYQNFKRYNIPKAQLIIADIPYNVGNNAYASNPTWYKDGDLTKGQSDKAGKQFFNSDINFNIAEFFHFASRLLKPEPKETGKAPCMIVFCAFDQIEMVKYYGEKYGFKNSRPLFFIKDYSPQVLKANMRIVGATEFAVLLYREKLPKFNNDRKMIFDWIRWERDNTTPKIHPTQKPIGNLKELISIFTDVGDVVIDPVAGSGTTLRAAAEMNRHAYGFEIIRDIYKEAQEKILKNIQREMLFEETARERYEQIELFGGI